MKQPEIEQGRKLLHLESYRCGNCGYDHDRYHSWNGFGYCPECNHRHTLKFIFLCEECEENEGTECHEVENRDPDQAYVCVECESNFLQRRDSPGPDPMSEAKSRREI